MDLTDVVDVGYGQGMGLGLFARATLWVEAGVGLSSTTDSREWYGRRSARHPEGAFVGLLAFTATGNYAHGEPPMSSGGLLFVNLLAVLDDEPPELIDRFQVGGRVYLPFVNLGLFVNLGEIVDLCAGLVGADPAADDGIAKSASL